MYLFYAERKDLVSKVVNLMLRLSIHNKLMMEDFDVALPVIKLFRDLYIKKAEVSIMVFRSELI